MLLKITWIVGLLATGMGVALLGSVKIGLAKRLGIDEGRVGGLVATFGFALIPVMLVMGFLTDLLDRRLVLIGGSALMTFSLLALAGVTKYRGALVATLLLSAGWAATVNVLNVLMQAVFGGSATYAMNLGNFVFGLGAFLTPLVVAALFGRAGWRGTLFLLATVAILPGLCAMGIRIEPPPAAPGAASGVGAILGDPIFWLTAIAMLFYAPLEATMGAWATTYLGEKRFADGAAATLLSGFWLGFTLSRLAAAMAVGAFPLTRAGTATLIVCLALCCVVVWWMAAASSGRRLAAASVLLAGVAFGPTFPTIIGVLTGHVAPALAGRAVGLFFMVGGVGWSIIPMFIGARARRAGIQGAFRLAVASAAGLLATALILRFYLR